MRISTKCSIAAHCMLFLHEYEADQKVTSGLLALSTGCNPVMIRSIMSALKKAGMVENVSDRGGMRLCCPLQEITLYRVCMAVEPNCLDELIGLHPTPSSFCPVGRNIHSVLKVSYHKLQESMRKDLQSITLSDIVEEYGKVKGKDASTSAQPH